MRKAEDSNPTPVKTHTRFERGLAPSPGHLPNDAAAEGGGLEPHTWRCPPGSSRRRPLAGSPSIVVQGGSRTRTPARAPRFERGVSPVPATWTSQCPGRESNSHARLERRLLRPVCLPVVPPPGRECGARGEGRTRMGRFRPLAPARNRTWAAPVPGECSTTELRGRCCADPWNRTRMFRSSGGCLDHHGQVGEYHCGPCGNRTRLTAVTGQLPRQMHHEPRQVGAEGIEPPSRGHRPRALPLDDAPVPRTGIEPASST